MQLANRLYSCPQHRNTPSIFLVGLALIGLSGCSALIVTQKSARSLRTHKGFTWETHEIEGFVVYVERDSAAAHDVDGLTTALKQASRQVPEYLDEPPYETTVSVFAVDSRDRMNELIGRRAHAMSFYKTNVICLAWDETWRIDPTHEFLHVVAMNRWSVPDRWINEGMAVDVAGSWRGHDLHALCKYLRARGELPSLKDIVARYNQLPGLVAYPAAGSFVRYIRQTYGTKALRLVWDRGRKALDVVTGKDIKAIEHEWWKVIGNASDLDAAAAHQATQR